MNKKGFTFLELILVVTIIAILAGSVVVLINPANYFKNNRNAQRQNDIHIILNAVYQYYTDNNGIVPAGIITSADCNVATAEICQTTAVDCTGLTDLSILTNNEIYITNLPIDPNNISVAGTGYHIVKSVNERITVCAPLAEEEVINITR